MRKRGISPLISWILLFGFAVAMAAMIYSWAVDQTENIDIVDGPDLYCDDVTLSIDWCERGPDCGLKDKYINVTFSNKGKWNLSGIAAHLETEGINGYPLSSCIYLLSSQPVLPGGETGLNFKLNYDPTLPDSNICNPCLPAYCGVEVVQIETAEFVPYIKPEDEIFACPSRKVILDPSRCVDSPEP